MKNLYILTLIALSLFSAMPLLALPKHNSSIAHINEVLIKKSEFKTTVVQWITQEIHSLKSLLTNPYIHKTFNSQDFKLRLSTTSTPYSYINKVYKNIANNLSGNEITINKAINTCIISLEQAKKEINNNYKNIYKNNKTRLKETKLSAFKYTLQNSFSPTKYLRTKLQEATLSKPKNNKNKSNTKTSANTP